MGKKKQPRRRGQTKEQKAAIAAARAEIGEKIKAALSESELNELASSVARVEAKARHAGQNEGVRYAFTLCMIVLCDKFGFGKVRLDRLWSHCKSYTEEIGAGRMDFELVAKTLEEEYGITVSTHN